MINKIVAVFLVLLYCNQSVAQLCQGSLGDPLVNITFAAGSNPGAALSAATTGYTYSSNDCPADGFYAVRNNSSACFGNTWHSLPTDHTGNPNGYFMLVNASLQPSYFFVDTVRGLCSNTNFEFAAWVVNVLKSSSCSGSGIRPNLTFTIERMDGTVLQTYNTGFIENGASPIWRQYGFFFTTPVGVSDVVLKIYNNSQGGCGNDLALDDITFKPCGPLINASIDGFASDSIFYCEANAVSYSLRTALSAGFSNPVYQWQQSTDGIVWADIPGAVSANYVASFAATTIGKFKYRLAAGEQVNFSSVKCRVLSPVITILKGSRPVTSMHITTPVCEDDTVFFSATGGNQYTWYRDGGGLGNTNASFNLPKVDTNLTGKIYVRIEGTTGCVVIDSAELQILHKPKIEVAFDTATICQGLSVQINSTGGITHSWQPTTGLSNSTIPNPIATPLVNTDYILTATGTNGCSSTDTARVKLIPPIVADAGLDKTIVKGERVQLENTTDTGFYVWSPLVNMDNPFVKQPIVSPLQDQEYVLTVTSLFGCNSHSDTVLVKVFTDVFVPRAFSPNRDGINDTWNIPALRAYPQFELYVYNRSGKQVYQSRNSFEPWDGTYKGNPIDAGNYVYVIKLNNAQKRVLKGNVILLR